MNKFEQEIDYNELIISSLSGNTTPDEKGLLEEWLHVSPENEDYFNKKRELWLATSQISESHNYNTLKAYNKLTGIIKNQSQNKALPVSYNYKTLFKIAASLIFMLFIGGISAYFFTKSYYTTQTSGIYYIEAPKGSRAVATLPDGTRVWLNAESKLQYSAAYNIQNREVKLSGEAYFKVETNPEKPFLVKTENITIKATGTSFNVKAYPNEKIVTTTLEEGKVELIGKGNNNQAFAYQMKPKQNVVYFDDKVLFAEKQTSVGKVEKNITHKATKAKEIVKIETTAPIVANTDVRTELYTSWKDENWLIESEKLEDLAVLLERRYNVQIVFASNEIKNYRFSATIQNETIEQIFDIIRLMLPISYTAEKGKITLTSDKKLKNIYRSAYQKQ